jgi:hypothetical protein
VDIFCIGQILEKKWEYNEAVNQLFIKKQNMNIMNNIHSNTQLPLTCENYRSIKWK